MTTSFFGSSIFFLILLTCVYVIGSSSWKLRLMQLFFKELVRTVSENCVALANHTYSIIDFESLAFISIVHT